MSAEQQQPPVDQAATPAEHATKEDDALFDIYALLKRMDDENREMERRSCYYQGFTVLHKIPRIP